MSHATVARTLRLALAAAALLLGALAPGAASAQAAGAVEPPATIDTTALVRAVTDDLRRAAAAKRASLRLDDESLRSLARLIVAEAARYALPPALVLAVIDLESGFRPDARSRSGALGLMQVMPFWPRDLGYRFGTDLLDVPTNLRYGMWVLMDALLRSDGDVEQALLRYNGCAGRRYSPTGCGDYPRAVRGRVELQARTLCRGQGWEACVAAPLRSAYEPVG